MKNLSLLIITLITSTFISQEYKIVHIKGGIYGEKLERNLILGDKLIPSENIEIKDDKVNCLLFNGTKKLALNSMVALKGGMVSEFFALAPERQLIASRGDKDSSYVKLEDYFSTTRYLMIDSVEEIKLDAKYINDLGSNKFLILDSEKKKTLLNFSNSTLLLETSKIFSADETVKKVEFYRVNTSTGEFVKEAQVEISKVNESELYQQIELIISTLSEGDNNLEKVYDVLIDIYGEMRKDKLELFMQQNNFLKD